MIVPRWVHNGTTTTPYFLPISSWLFTYLEKLCLYVIGSVHNFDLKISLIKFFLSNLFGQFYS
jgi:hypothetical protein